MCAGSEQRYEQRYKVLHTCLLELNSRYSVTFPETHINSKAHGILSLPNDQVVTRSGDYSGLRLAPSLLTTRTASYNLHHGSQASCYPPLACLGTHQVRYVYCVTRENCGTREKCVTHERFVTREKCAVRESV